MKRRHERVTLAGHTLGLTIANDVPGDTDWCGAWNAGSPIANTGQDPAPNLSHLSAVWCNTVATRVAPSTQVRFGIPRAPCIYLRERY